MYANPRPVGLSLEISQRELIAVEEIADRAVRPDLAAGNRECTACAAGPRGTDGGLSQEGVRRAGLITTVE